ncbi:MAG: hypothetical protein JNJ58_01770 [Chitinophagaceae bacterium]|nr:hypothetical protein [Chitinophagaceae bacterium]
MKKILLLLFLAASTGSIFAEPSAISVTHNMLAPKKKKKNSGNFDKTRLLLGPNLGFGAGSRAFSINLAPSLAYCLTDNFYVGTTLGFNYYQEAFDYNNVVTGQKETFKFKIPAYSFSIYARYMVRNFLILNVEPEMNWTKFVYQPSYNLQTGKLEDQSTRLLVPSLLLGAGYMQRFGNYGHTYLMVLYDLVQNPNSRYYQTLDFRFGVMLSLWN